MPTRKDILTQACDQCIEELYTKVQPTVTWEDFKQQYKEYGDKYRKWEKLENRPDITEYCGPRPYEFYYLPKEIRDEICESYIDAYRIDQHQELLNTILILKNYCREPIIDKYIEGDIDGDGEYHPGYRGYDNPDNLEKELQKIFDDKILPDICKQYNKQYNLQTTGIESSVSKAYSQIFQDKFFEFLDRAGNFFNWNGDLNSFYMSVCLGASPNSNKQAVIDNWKKYRKQDIEIDEEQIKKDYYGELD